MDNKFLIKGDRKYSIDFKKLEGVYNIEYLLIKILFEETPITLNEEIIKKYRLQDYVVEV